MENIQLETQRLYLRSMQPSDLEDLLKIFGDPKVMASFNSPVFSRQQMEGWLQRNLAHQEQHGYGLFSVILKSEGILIGDCGLEHMEVNGKPVAELGYDFRSDYWNKGYATEAAVAVRDYAFNSLHLPTLISLIRVGNQASKHVAKKVGMRLIETFTQSEIRYWRYAIDNIMKPKESPDSNSTKKMSKISPARDIIKNINQIKEE